MSNETAIQKLLRDQEATLFGASDSFSTLISPENSNRKQQKTTATVAPHQGKITSQRIAFPVQEEKKNYCSIHKIEDEIHQVFGAVRTECNKVSKTQRKADETNQQIESKAPKDEKNVNSNLFVTHSNNEMSDQPNSDKRNNEMNDQPNSDKLIEDEIRQAKDMFPHLVTDYQILKRDFTRLLQDSTQNIFRLEELETDLSKTKKSLEKERQCKMNLDCIKRLHARLGRVEHEKRVLFKLVKTYRERLEGIDNPGPIINDAWVVNNKPAKDETSTSEDTASTLTQNTGEEAPSGFIPKTIRVQEARMSSNDSIEI